MIFQDVNWTQFPSVRNITPGVTAMRLMDGQNLRWDEKRVLHKEMKGYYDMRGRLVRVIH